MSLSFYIVQVLLACCWDGHELIHGCSLALVEIRLVLTHLLWTFDMELAEETDEEWPKQKMWTTWEKKPLIVKLTERKV